MDIKEINNMKLINTLEKAMIKEPTLPFEIGYNMAMRHAIEHIKWFEEHEYPLSRNDYQE